MITTLKALGTIKTHFNQFKTEIISIYLFLLKLIDIYETLNQIHYVQQTSH